MSRRALILVGVLGLSLLLGLGAALSRRARAPDAAASAPPAVDCCGAFDPTEWAVALGGGRALRVLAPDGQPLQVEQVGPQGGGWRWSGRPGRLEWSRRGPLVVGQGPGEPVPGRGSAPDRLELFDVERGHRTTLPAVTAWCFAGEGVAAVVSRSREASEVALVAPDGRARWTATLPTSRALVLAQAGDRLAAWSRTHAWAVALDAGGVTPLGEAAGVAGVVSGALLALRDGRLVALPVTGAGPTPLDLTGGEPLLDGTRFVPPRPPGTSPRLVGRHAGRWIVAYATETTTDSRTNDEGWRTPATQHLAAIDPASCQVQWRRTLGPIELAGEATDGEALADDLVTLGWTEDETHERTFWLGAVALADGALRWSTTWPARDYGADPGLVRRGGVTYLLAQGLDFEGLLARFDGGRFTGGLRGLASQAAAPLALEAEEMWARTADGLVRLPAPALTGLPPSLTSPGDVGAAVADRLALPPAAR